MQFLLKHSRLYTYILIWFLRWRRVRERYYWKNSYADVKKFIKECDHCQRKPLTEIASIPLIPSEVESAPFYEIGLDLVGPLEPTKNGEFIYIIIKEEKSAFIQIHCSWFIHKDVFDPWLIHKMFGRNILLIDLKVLKYSR